MDIGTVVTSILSSSFISAILTKYLDWNFKIEKFKINKLLAAEQQVEKLEDNHIYTLYDNEVVEIFEKNKRFFSKNATTIFYSTIEKYYDDEGHLKPEYQEQMEVEPESLIDFKYVLLNIIREELDFEINSPLIAKIVNAVKSNFNYFKKCIKKENY